MMVAMVTLTDIVETKIVRITGIGTRMLTDFTQTSDDQ